MLQRSTVRSMKALDLIELKQFLPGKYTLATTWIMEGQGDAKAMQLKPRKSHRCSTLQKETQDVVVD